MAQRYYAGEFNGGQPNNVLFELFVNGSGNISRFYCTNNSQQAASGTLTKTATGQIVAQATFLPGESYIAIEGSNPYVEDAEGDPVWPFSIQTAFPI